MNDSVTPVTIRVLGKDYRIACAEEEHDDLLESARYLDQRMREVRDTGKVVGQERIAVMAALNITHELTQASKYKSETSGDMAEKLSRLSSRIEQKIEDLQSE